MLPFIWFNTVAGGSLMMQTGYAAASLLFFPPITAFLALNFTGATTFASRTGVRKEIFTYIRVMAAMFVTGFIIALFLFLARNTVI